MDFIEDYRNYITQHVPATNPDWAESIAINVLNAVLGNRIHIWTEIGRLYPNLFFLNIGLSGLAHKTTPIKYYAIPTLVRYGELTETKPILPSRWSVEGMIEYLSTKQNNGLMIRDEFSSIFKDTKKRYLADVLEFLSEMYDYMLQKRFTRKTKLEETLDVCVSLTSCTTPYIFDMMDMNFFVQGTGNRFLYIWTSPKLPDKTDKDFFMRGEDRQQREEDMKQFAERLKSLDDILTKFGFLQPIYYKPELLLDFKDNLMKKTKDSYDKDPKGIDHSYLSRMAEMAIKLAAIKALSRLEDRLKELPIDKPYYPVHEDEIKWAINRVNKHIEYFEQLKDNWGMFTKRKPVMTAEKEFDYIKSILKTNDSRLTHMQLLRLSKWTTKQFREVISALVFRGEIEQTTGKGSIGGGRKPTVYVLLKTPKKEEVT